MACPGTGGFPHSFWAPPHFLCTLRARPTFLSLSLIVAVLPAQAQVPAMNLVGNVQSDDQRALPGAAITVIHVPSGVRHVAASDATGRFIVSNLMVGGPYLMQVGEGGYRPQTMGNIFLENGLVHGDSKQNHHGQCR